MLLALLALVVTAAITLSMGQGIRLLVDQGFMTRSAHQLNQTISLFLLLVLALAVGTFSRFYLVSWIGERCVADIRRAVFDHLIGLHPGFFEDNRSSEIQSRLTADTTLLQSVIGSSLSMFLRNALMVIGGVVLLFITNPKLTSIVVVALPLVLAPILLFGRRVRRLSRQSQDRVADVGSYVAETLGQIKTVQAYNHQAHDRKVFAGAVEAAFAVARQRIAQRAWLITLVIVLVLGAVGVMLWVGGMDVIAGRISAGELAAFVFYSLLVGSAFGTLSEVIGELQRAAGHAQGRGGLVQRSLRLCVQQGQQVAQHWRQRELVRQRQQRPIGRARARQAPCRPQLLQQGTDRLALERTVGGMAPTHPGDRLRAVDEGPHADRRAPVVAVCALGPIACGWGLGCSHGRGAAGNPWIAARANRGVPFRHVQRFLCAYGPATGLRRRREHPARLARFDCDAAEFAAQGACGQDTVLRVSRRPDRVRSPGGAAEPRRRPRCRR